jgi:penicillin amidase
MMVLGYLHASDRLWQMELRRRGAQGRLSEIVGASAVETDFALRRYDLAGVARQDLEELPDDLRELIDAYARGVNRFIHSRRNRLPPEFLLLRFRPEPWRMEDTLAFTRMMLLNLTAAGRSERQRYSWFHRLGSAHALDLLRIEPGAPDEPFRPPELDLYFRDTRPLSASPSVARLEQAPGGERSWSLLGERAAAGSNSWSLAPSRAENGSALLANDPHLGVEQPSIWYEAGIITPELHVRGLTLAGAPGIVIGRNRHLAWGTTVHQADDQDLFMERIDNDASPPRVFEEDAAPGGGGSSQGGQWVETLEREETVLVRDGPPVTRRVLRTSRGLLLPADEASGRPAMSLRTAFLEGPGALGVFWKISRARGAEELLAALRGFSGPALNFSYADDSGAIGFKTAGLVPRRRSGDGRLPVPGWSGDYGWDGWIDFEELPGSHDPESGFAVTANNELFDPDATARYSGEWAPPFRAGRIAERLAEERSWSVETLQALQTDVLSRRSRAMVDALERLLPHEPQDSPDAARALRVLRGWDGTMALQGPARLAAELTRELVERITGDEARAAGAVRLVGPSGVLRLIELNDGSLSADWFDDVSTEVRETAGEVVTSALAGAYRRVVDACGEDPARWDWGEVHSVRFEHPLGRASGLTRWLDLGPVPLPGDGETVNASIYSLSDPFRVRHIPSARLLFDLGDPDRTLAILPTGQSGHPLSRHYGDQLAMWAAGEYRPAPFTEPASRAAAVETLHFDP